MSAGLVIFDVNETLSDLEPMGERFADVGAPAHLAPTWFAGVLRDGFALTAVGASAPFVEIAGNHLRIVLGGVDLDRPVDDAVSHVLSGFGALDVHPDVADGVRSLAADGHRLVTLSNGSASVAEKLLEAAGLREHFEALLSVEDAGVWKPAAGAYAYALERCGVEAADAVLVAVHPWDIDGAARAGLRTAWIDRNGSTYPDHFTAPDHHVTSLDELAALLR
ncbi:haloacid dehalogenase type II [Nocardioides sp.]|uniref:haloacid dehalogenase type II n=1 Tax=Nocardioides sp. TaxID=35761 RepID=UPI002B2773CE|nr:haloacid dehalogenase type II [Nocardioides sp.]